MKKKFFIIFSVITIIFSSCNLKNKPFPQKDKINLFEDFKVSQKKEMVTQFLTDKNVIFKTSADYAKASEEMTDDEKEKMPEDYIRIETSVYGKESIVEFYFWNNELYKIEYLHFKPFGEKDTLKANQDLLETFNILDEKMQGYFISSTRKEYTDIINQKHVSFDIGFFEKIDLKINEFSVSFDWFNKDINDVVSVEKEKYKESVKRQNPEYYGKWHVQNNDICYLADLKGVFSNSAVEKRELSGICYIVRRANYDEVEFRLYEYESNVVKRTGYGNIYTVFITNLNKPNLIYDRCSIWGTEIELGEKLSKQLIKMMSEDNPRIEIDFRNSDKGTVHQLILGDELYGISKAMEKRKSYVPE